MKEAETPKLTSALEDYLETIFEFTQRQGFIRVKDIVRERNVKAGSVSPAMRRLSAMGLIDYERREYIKLTDRGEKLAREIFSKHEVLARFFSEILHIDRDEAVKNACAMEHSLTEVAKEHLVLFMEFLLNCSQVNLAHWRSFHQRQIHHNEEVQCEHDCDQDCIFYSTERSQDVSHVHLVDMKPGDGGTVIILEGEGNERRRLLNMGFIPGVEVTVEHHYPDGEHTEVRLNSYSLKFPRALGRYVLVDKSAN